MSLRTRAILLGVVLPVIVLGAAYLLIRSWQPRRPDPMVLHWGVDGVDRVGSFSAFLTPFAVLAAVICVPAILLALVVKGAARRGMVGLSAGLATMMGGIAVGAAAIQLDAADAYAVGSPGAALMLPILASVAIGLLATWLAGSDAPRPTSQAVPDDAPRLPLDGDAPSTDLVWSAPLPAVPLAFPVVTIGVLLVMAILVGMLSGDWWLLIFPVLMGAVMLVALGWHIRIDRDGLTMRAMLGWPSYRVPADEIVRADAVEIRPFAEFGGWGLRIGAQGTLGFVTRHGEGFLLERTGNRRVAVTVDDAARAAAALNTVADLARGPQPHHDASGPDR